MDWLYFACIGYLLRYLILVHDICTSYIATLSILFLSVVIHPDSLLRGDQPSYWELFTLLSIQTLDQT